MILYSFRFPRRLRRSAAVLLLAVAVLGLGRLASGGETETPASAVIRRQAGKKEEQRQEFMQKLGWEVDPAPCETVDVVIPKEFDEIYLNYNALQTEQGMGLEKYRGKRCTRYSYAVLNHPSGAAEVRLNLLVCAGKIVGGDVCSLGLDGFMQGLAFPESPPPAPRSAVSRPPAPKSK
ncbi:MAG: DUF4830 domain-containing protein [Oscillospiraceae bacterium]